MDFMISSGLMTDMAAIPVPDLAVPYAAPRELNTMAVVAPKLEMHTKKKHVRMIIDHVFFIATRVV